MYITADQIEAQTASRQLCDLLETGDAVVRGSNLCNVGEILRVMAECFQAETEKTANEQKAMQTCGILSDDEDAECFAHKDTLSRMKALIRTLGSSADTQGAFTTLPPEMVEVLRNAASA